MKTPACSRRAFVHGLSTALAAGVLAPRPVAAARRGRDARLHIATNQYPWGTFYAREGRNFGADLDAALGEVAQSGLDGYEPLVTAPEELDTLAPLLLKHRLELRSLYVNSVLHERDHAESSIAQVLAIAAKAKPLGTRFIVTNPSPLKWGGPETKSDAQLRVQAEALGRLGRKLADLGLTLAYHNHDLELRHAAREFHHMMLATDPRDVTLCLDAHWMFRGAGNSAIALFDLVKLYAPRIAELHLRQSRGGIWTETFGDGDIDYPALVHQLALAKRRPHVVLEQAVESGTPRTLGALEAHRLGLEYARRVFGPLL